MIKIAFNPSKRDKICRLVLEDAKEQTTGLIQILNNENNRVWLKQNFIEIYNVLYSEDVVNEKSIKELLCADKNRMQQYIDRLGKFDEEKSNQLLKRIFKYRNFSKRETAYKILELMDIKVCPYCNRQYIVTLKNKKVRPQFDHYYPKSMYPYLALSIFNLIPCCSICNMAKAALDTNIKPVLYPYTEEFGHDVIFTAEKRKDVSLHLYTMGLTDQFDINITKTKEVLPQEAEKIDQQIETLHLKDLYNEHKDHVQEIYKHHYIYTPKRLRELCITFPDLFHSVEEAKNFIYLTEMEKENWGKRPLAKLTSDIVRELENKIF